MATFGSSLSVSSFVLICLPEASHSRDSFSSCRYQCFILNDCLSKASVSSMTGFVSSQQEDRLIHCLFSLPGQSVSDSAESDIGSFIFPYIPVMSHWNLDVRCLCVLFHSFRATGLTCRRSFNTLFSNIASRQMGHGSQAHDTDKWKKHWWDIQERNNKAGSKRWRYSTF